MVPRKSIQCRARPPASAVPLPFPREGEDAAPWEWVVVVVLDVVGVVVVVVVAAAAAVVAWVPHYWSMAMAGTLVVAVAVVAKLDISSWPVASTCRGIPSPILRDRQS